MLHGFKFLKYFFILFILAILLFIGDKLDLLKPFKGRVGDLVAPEEEIVYGSWQKIGNEFKVWTFWRNGTQKVKNLEERNRELAVKAAKAESLEREIKALREQLGVDLDNKGKYILAKTIGFKNNLKINKGTKDGISVGMVVIKNNIFVGVIDSVSLYNSLVMLPSDSSSKLEVYDVNTGSKGIGRGQFDNSLILDNVLQTERIYLGDIIATSGESGTIPPDLYVGKITEVMKKESEVFQRALIQPLISYKELEYVFVIK